MKKVTFSYQPPITGDFNIYLVGDFNDWNGRSHVLIEDSGIYKTTIELNPGKYKYYFLMNDKKVLDPASDTIYTGKGKVSIIEVESETEYLYLVPIKIEDNTRFEEISIVGDFNEWKPNSNRFYQTDNNLRTCLFLSKGQYQYKYLAKDDKWYNQEEIQSSKVKKSHDNKSPNSLIVTNLEDYQVINLALIKSYDTNNVVFKDEIIRIYRYSQEQFEFKVVLPKWNNLALTLQLNEKSYDMNFIASNKYLTTYNQLINIIDINMIYSLSLTIKTDDTILYANIRNISNNKHIQSVFSPNTLKIFSIDTSLNNRIIYQIMPDRFANGDPSINPDFQEDYYQGTKQEPSLGSLKKNQEYYHLLEWQNIDILTRNPYSNDKEPDWFAFYGGDLLGVKAKIPYLKELGITLIYLNPIFTAKSPHRYDTIDFRQVDPHLGTNQVFGDLVFELHKNGIKVIIDIALNHCGIDFFAFKDCIDNGKKSKYWSWFDWYQWPLPQKIDEKFNAEDYYQCWWGIKDLPEFNYDLARSPKEENKITDIRQAQVNVKLVNYLLEAMRTWVVDYDIDGFRLDVPEEVPFWFWKTFRDILKGIKSDIYLVGEIWNNPKVWLQGNYFDGIMNYHFFKDPVVEYFFKATMSLTTFINEISSGLMELPWQVLKNQMNLLASHDTIRLRRLAKDNLDKLKVALIFQFTYIGIPHIYYGDEVFLDGNKDPDNRRPFPWDYAQDKTRIELFDFYKSLIKLRKDHNLLSEGYIQFIEHEELLIYKRWSIKNESELIVIINRNDTQLDISDFINEYPKVLLRKNKTNNIQSQGYYIGMK